MKIRHVKVFVTVTLLGYSALWIHHWMFCASVRSDDVTSCQIASLVTSLFRNHWHGAAKKPLPKASDVQKLFYKDKNLFSKIERFNEKILWFSSNFEQLGYSNVQCGNVTVDTSWEYTKARGFVHRITEDDVNPRTVGTVDWFNQQTLTDRKSVV